MQRAGARDHGMEQRKEERALSCGLGWKQRRTRSKPASVAIGACVEDSLNVRPGRLHAG